EVLGRLLYTTYDKDNNYFDEQKVSELAQIDWSRRNTLWENNIIRKTGNSDYEIVNRVNPVLDAVKAVKTFLIWI
ncbi:MAG: DNA sulfur modification protein DndB, partial [Dolichospermum sp.]